MKDYYQILEVATDTSQDNIKEQYLFLVHAWHPDKFPNPVQKLKAEEKLKEINAAYEILHNPVKRSEYDSRSRNTHSRHEQEYRTQTNKRESEDERYKKEEEARRAKEEKSRKERTDRERAEAEKRNSSPPKKISTGHRDWVICSRCGSKQYRSNVKCNNCTGKFK